MNTITFGEDITLHPWMPTPGLMAEVSPDFQKLFDSSRIRQIFLPFSLE
jgi:hypothetical protein